MRDLTIGDYFERIVSLARSAVDHRLVGIHDPATVRKEIATELDCMFGPSNHECDAVVGAMAMLVAAGYARNMDLKASMVRWLRTASQHPGGILRPDGGRASADDVVK